MATQRKTYSTTEVGSMFGKSAARIRQICENELSVGENPNGRGWMIPESDLPKLRKYFDAHGKDFSK